MNLKPGDDLVIDKLNRSPTGVSALTVGKVSLGSRARKHSAESLMMVGLQVAVRLVGAGLLEATPKNQFKLSTRRTAPASYRTEVDAPPKEPPEISGSPTLLQAHTATEGQSFQFPSSPPSLDAHTQDTKPSLHRYYSR